MSVYANLVLSRKIPGLVAIAALLAVVAVETASHFLAASASRHAAEEKFTALVQERHDALASYLGSIREDVMAIAASGQAADALAAYQHGWGELAGGGEPPRRCKSSTSLLTPTPPARSTNSTPPTTARHTAPAMRAFIPGSGSFWSRAATTTFS